MLNNQEKPTPFHDLANVDIVQSDIDRIDRVAVAKRIRELVADPSGEYMDIVADRLGVTEDDLRVSIEGEQPHPTPEVLAAVVREYGVDPSWLLTGDYDSATHRRVLQSPEGATPEALERIVRDHQTPAGVLNVQPIVPADSPPLDEK